MSKIRPSKGAPYARILGVGGYRPVRVVPNEVILETIDSSDEWIRSRSGIETRHWASDEETVAAMSIEASGKAIADAGINADQIGAVVVSTVSHFSQTPAVATEIADKLGTQKAAAFDISAKLRGLRLRPHARQGHDRRGFGGVRPRHRRGAAVRPDRPGGPCDGLPVR